MHELPMSLRFGINHSKTEIYRCPPSPSQMCIHHMARSKTENPFWHF